MRAAATKALLVALTLCLAAPLASAQPGSEGPDAEWTDAEWTDAEWTVADRMRLLGSGEPLDLSSVVRPHEETVRVVLSGTFSFGVDGSRIDAMSRTVGGARDVAAGPFVVLPPGTQVIASDEAAHRYTVEIPRAASMPLSFNVFGLATRHLMTPTEVRANLVGAIEVEHLVPPPPPPPPAPATVQAARAASEVPVWGWIAGLATALLLLGLAPGFARRRRDPIAKLLRRARRARKSIAHEVLSLGPAFDPVAASAEALYEAAAQHAGHHASILAALRRTASMASGEAAARRRTLASKRDEVFATLRALVGRLEATATELAGRAADADQARGVDTLLAELGTDLQAAVEAEEELAL